MWHKNLKSPRADSNRQPHPDKISFGIGYLFFIPAKQRIKTANLSLAHLFKCTAECSTVELHGVVKLKKIFIYKSCLF